MKAKLLSVIPAVLIGLFCWVTAAESYDIRDYLPLSQGSAFVYSEIGGETQNIQLRALFGLELVGLVPCQRMWYFESEKLLELLESEYDCLAWNPLRGLIQPKDVQLQGADKTGYTIYDSQNILLPRMIDVGEEFETSSTYTKYDASDTVVSTGTIERSETLIAIEDVTVRAGTFPGCLRFLETVFWEESDGSYGNWEMTFWLGPGIGPVKWNETATEYTPGEGETIEGSSWELLIGFANLKPILPTPE